MRNENEMVAETIMQYMNTPIETRFKFSWSLICKLACKALVHNKSFEDMCVWALGQQSREMKNERTAGQ